MENSKEEKLVIPSGRRLGLYASYLGAYWEVPGREELSFLNTNGIIAKGRFVIQNYDSSRIRKLVSALLIKNGRQNYKIMHSFEVVDYFFGEEKDNLLNEVTVVIVSKDEMENKRRWELLYQFAVTVVSERKYLIVITDYDIKNELDTFKEIGFRVINSSLGGRKKKEKGVF